MAKKTTKKGNTVPEKETQINTEEIVNEDINNENDPPVDEIEVQDDRTPEQKLLEEVAQLKNTNLRLLAEFDNFRKRTRKEQADLITFASERVIKSFLPVLDDFGRTLQVIEKSDNVASMKEGIKLVSDHMWRVFEKEGVKRIDSIGLEFDSEVHEAITKIPVPEEEKKGKVVDEVERGYFLKEKVIRYSKVVIGE